MHAPSPLLLRHLRSSLLLRYPESRSLPHHHARHTFLKPPSLSSLGLSSSPQHLSAQRLAPYPRLSLFKTIAAIESYPLFLPYVLSANVTRRSEKDRWPERAELEVGYGGYKERFTSVVRCDEGGGRVEARAGGEGEGEELFQHLRTCWTLEDVKEGEGKGGTMVNLEIEVQFVSPVYAALSQAVEGRVVGGMIEAFERRVRDVEGKA